MTNKELSNIDAYSEIRNLKASVGGYFGGYYEMEIHFDSKELKWEHRGDGEVDYYAKTIRQNTSDKFINELRDLGLLR
ncbi:hypothetical protein [Jeotgalibaca sp. A122]|uniref:hypothetical protein n=1 Tax=Jeotgalibaca sp. A122 TaxID=3457322 RepID=UPI003FCFF8A6